MPILAKLKKSLGNCIIGMSAIILQIAYSLVGHSVRFGFGITESTGDTTLSRVPGTFLSVLSVLSVLKIGDFWPEIFENCLNKPKSWLFSTLVLPFLHKKSCLWFIRATYYTLQKEKWSCLTLAVIYSIFYWLKMAFFSGTEKYRKYRWLDIWVPKYRWHSGKYRTLVGQRLDSNFNWWWMVIGMKSLNNV